MTRKGPSDDEWSFVAAAILAAGVIALVLLIAPIASSRNSFYMNIASEALMPKSIDDR